MTIGHAGKNHDSFEPSPIGELAKWTIEERDKGGLRRRRWRPYEGASCRDVASPAAEAA
jgi:hypothetical protein